MWAVALRNGHESFHFVRNGSESFLGEVRYKAGTKASRAGMGCKEGGRGEMAERTAKKAPVKPHGGRGRKLWVCGCLVPG